MQVCRRWLPRTFRGLEEPRQVSESPAAQAPELRHHTIPESGWICDVLLEEGEALPPPPDRGEVAAPEVPRAGSEIGVAGQAAAQREGPRAGDCMRIVLEALAPCPARNVLTTSAAREPRPVARV